jgi:hypothetical protein
MCLGGMSAKMSCISETVPSPSRSMGPAAPGSKVSSGAAKLTVSNCSLKSATYTQFKCISGLLLYDSEQERTSLQIEAQWTPET